MGDSLEHEPEIESLARRLAGVDADEAVIALARRVSEAQVDLNRLRAVRRRFIINRFDVRPPMLNRVTVTVPLNPIAEDDKLAAILADSEYATLDRYERRALSRRKFAIREFDKRVRLLEECTNS